MLERSKNIDWQQLVTASDKLNINTINNTNRINNNIRELNINQ